MATIIREDNSALIHRTYKVPSELFFHLKSILSQNINNKNASGYKRLQTLINNGGIIKYNEMKRIKNFFDNYEGDINNITFILNGGKNMQNWINDTLQISTDSIKNDKEAKMNSGMENAFRKSHTKDRLTKNSTKVTTPVVSVGSDKSKQINNNKVVHYESVKKIKIVENQLKLLKDLSLL